MSKYEGGFFDDHSEPPLAEEPVAVTLDQGFTEADLEAALDLGESMAQPRPQRDEELWGMING
jgi:hypothetical protein